MISSFASGIMQSSSEFFLQSEELLEQVEKGAFKGEQSLRQAYNLWLSRYFRTEPSRTDNIDENRHLTKENCDIFTGNVKISRDKQLAGRFTLVHIEPIIALAKEYQNANLIEEYTNIMVVYDFILSMRRLYREFFKL